MVTLPRLTPATLDFALLSFEGPDQYSMAGGLGVRMKELALELARQGHRTHLIFVGDPHLPAQESPVENLTLHRWGQWLSAHHPGGVYQGEEAKLIDWNRELPGFVTSTLVAPAAAEGRLVAILAEEWHTAFSTCQLSDRLWSEGLRDKTIILWNANNVMGFDRIDWKRLDFCSQITTVSRYMKHVMWEKGVNPLVIPNGIPADRIRSADPAAVTGLRAAFPQRDIIFKIGRFSPDKRWNMAVSAAAEEKRRGRDVAMVIRGGVEPHGIEVLANARREGLEIIDLRLPKEPNKALAALVHAPRADLYNIASFMSDELISVFYTGADAVLANSGHEPFGLVGLEVMGAGGIAFLGSTGEDYAVPFLNSVVLDTDDPSEINTALDFLRRHPEVAARMRTDGQETARNFSWENVIADNIIGKLEYVCGRQLVCPPGDSAKAAKTAGGAVPPAGSGTKTAPTPKETPPTAKQPTSEERAGEMTTSTDCTSENGPACSKSAGACSRSVPAKTEEEATSAAAMALVDTVPTAGPAHVAETLIEAPAVAILTAQPVDAPDDTIHPADAAGEALLDPPAVDLSGSYPAYGGEATGRRLSVKPQNTENCDGAGEATGDPAPAQPKRSAGRSAGRSETRPEVRPASKSARLSKSDRGSTKGETGTKSGRKKPPQPPQPQV